MKSEVQAVVLILLLLVVTFALGVEFGGSGLPGASGNLGGPTASGKQITAAVVPPEFVVQAKGIDQEDLYLLSQLRTLPPGALPPLVGLRVTLLTQGRSATSFRRLPALTLTTNASGLASAALPSGIYEILVVGSTFSLDTSVTLTDNSTATLNVQMHPSGQPVADLRVVSPDTTSGVESASRLYALLDNATAPPPGPSELVGYQAGSNASASGTVSVVTQPGINGSATLSGSGIRNPTYTGLAGPLVSINATLYGSYRGTTGYWATLYPAGTYATFPSVGVMLFQFEPTAEVNYTAG